MQMFGKVMVVAILVLSLIYMGMATAVYSTHTNWRDIVTNKLKPQLQDLRSANQNLKDQIQVLTENIDTEKKAHADAVAKLETEYDRLRAEHADLLGRYDGLVQSKDTAIAAMEGSEKTLADLRDKVGGLRDQVRNVEKEKDEQFQQMVDLTDKVLQSQTELDRLQNTNLQLVEQTGRLKKVVDRHGLNEFESEDNLPPKVDGVVTDVGPDGLIEISIGSDDGVRRGHRLEVYRANRYLGKIEIVKASPDKAVAKVLPEFRQGSIQEKDRVATRLN
jgi:predicted  nucleic acid-binding Zn-ribbon protein